ncbi:AraC family transcriptional regulator [Pseudomonas sp. C 49-2]|uniref:AraC family transcriptional regulator n=1 Tax=Pseudomonas canadensis TaxID=915099 RepID=A0A423FH22_9PSED|nr:MULTISPECIES: helix-turn-helix transcriptional regulator [Pseudomonas]ROM57023.1 AraC family transcriptional regulator [Pseudomonas canadensis]RTX95460.1 AraC family transcriptional regulator [Pseudomonas sp. C 49-2]
MKQDARAVGKPVELNGRSEDYLDYQDVPRVLMALVRNQAAGAYNAPHTHRHGQLLYAVSGVMRAVAQGSLWFLPPKRALWIPAEEEHDQLMLTPVQMRSIYIQADAAAGFGDRCRIVDVSLLLRELILVLANEPIEYELEGRNSHVVALILSELAAARTLPLQIPWPVDRRLLMVCRAILETPGQTHTVAYWADQVGASSRTLIRLFLKETGLTYRQWVQQVRLACALERLENGEPIGRIAQDLGYVSASAFSAMFRRAIGVSPRDFLVRD